MCVCVFSFFTFFSTLAFCNVLFYSVIPLFPPAFFLYVCIAVVVHVHLFFLRMKQSIFAHLFVVFAVGHVAFYLRYSIFVPVVLIQLFLS